MLKLSQVHATAAEANALGFQQKALFHGRFAAQRDAPTRAQNALPRQASDLLQHAANVPGAARVSGRLGNGAVGAHPAAWDLADSLANGWD